VVFDKTFLARTLETGEKGKRKIIASFFYLSSLFFFSSSSSLFPFPAMHSLLLLRLRLRLCLLPFLFLFPFHSPFLVVAEGSALLSPAQRHGVNVHFTDNMPEFSMMASAFRTARMDFSWATCEQVREGSSSECESVDKDL
jgi:hypothetical protein